MSKNNPNVYIIAGPNGAGKTTFARQFLPLIARGIGDKVEIIDHDLYESILKRKGS